METQELTNNERLANLYNKHYKSLLKYSYSLSKDEIISEELVSQLILFLAEKVQPRLYFLDSFNLYYCQKFLNSKYINLIKYENTLSTLDSDKTDILEEEYDVYADKMNEELLEAYKEIINSVKLINRKYGNSYVKNKLYGVSVKNCAKLLGCHVNSIYSHFKEFDLYIENEFNKRKDEIINKYKEN